MITMMLLRNNFLYHVRKPRVVSQIELSYKAYQATLKDARKAIHRQAYEYLQQIQDAYLDQHHQSMKNKHFEYQCSFRKQIFTDAFRLHQNQLRWKKIDEDYTANLNKHLHDEDIKKINRSRIIKIMEHQSSNYWFNSDNVDERLQEKTIFPEYIASSEYYYKLYAEALAYQTGDFKQLHNVSSNEETIREKNKYLIPLFLNLRSKISNFKRDEVKEAKQRNSFELNLIQTNPNLTKEKAKQLIEKLNMNFENQLKQIEIKKQKLGKLAMLKIRIKDIISIFKTWKQYTNILALTSAQIINNKSDVTRQLEIQKNEKQVLKNLSSKLHETFIDSIQQDTEQIQMSFDQYISKINQNRKQRQVDTSGSVNMEDLDSLMNNFQVDKQFEADQLSLKLNQHSELNILTQNLNPSATQFEEEFAETQQINPLFMNQRETTATVEILKQHYKNDGQMMILLNQLGQIDVRYPKLFESIWQSIH